jgi:serine/threonine protein kinase
VGAGSFGSVYRALDKALDLDIAIKILHRHVGDDLLRERLLAEGRAQGLSEGAAMLQANKGMQRLGLYPKTPTITAVAAACDSQQPVFHISDEEFRVGLFQDIRQAIDRPGEAADFHGDYVTHRDYATSRQLNDFLADRSHREFLVDDHGGCWRLSIDHR